MVPPAVCFLRWTLVLTPEGETPVEELDIGDLVVTAKGTALPVKWIGRRHFNKDAGSDWPKAIARSRIAFALDEHTPHRDLYGPSAYDALRTSRLLQRPALGVEGDASPSSVSGRGHPRPDPVDSRSDSGARCQDRVS